MVGILQDLVEEWAVIAQDPTENDRAEVRSPDIAARALTLLSCGYLRRGLSTVGVESLVCESLSPFWSLYVQLDYEGTGSKLTLELL